ncbi:MAG: ADP-ribosylglycohydrolase family protein [Candidatus Bathyarchaeia archaeon]
MPSNYGQLLSKFIGCMLGCAVGDVLGLGYYLGSYNGTWSDDTHMMIGVAESLIANRGFNGEHMAWTFIKNYEKEPWRGYAIGPPMVFGLIKSGVPWKEAAKKLFGGAGSFGNGAAMRVAPVGLLYFDDPKMLREVARNQSIITHAHELGIEGAIIQAYAVSLAVKADKTKGINPRDFLDNLISLTENNVYRLKLKMVLLLLEEENKLIVVKGLGNSVEAFNSVPTAIYCFLRNLNSFRGALEYAVSLGGDADTIGAMTGAISGAYHGAEAIPSKWLRELERREYIENLAKQIWKMKIRHMKKN